MVYCVALGCINRDTDHKPGITFHRFPKDEEKRKAWAEAIQRQDLVPDDWSTVCSIHFLDEFLDRNLASDEPVTLKENAIPSLLYHQQFPTEQCLPTTKRKRKSTNPRRLISENLCDVPLYSSYDSSGDSESSPRKAKFMKNTGEAIHNQKHSTDV